MRELVTGVLVLASVAAASSPAVAENPTRYAEGTAWIVHRNAENCSVSIGYEKNTTLYVSYTYGKNSSFLVVRDPIFRSIKDGEDYSVEITFKKGGRLDTGWGEKSMQGLTVVGTPGIGVHLDARDLLDDLKVSTDLVLTRDDYSIVVESLDLTGSSIPITKLEQCAKEVHRTNPADPFAP